MLPTLAGVKSNCVANERDRCRSWRQSQALEPEMIESESDDRNTANCKQHGRHVVCSNKRSHTMRTTQSSNCSWQCHYLLFASSSESRVLLFGPSRIFTTSPRHVTLCIVCWACFFVRLNFRPSFRLDEPRDESKLRGSTHTIERRTVLKRRCARIKWRA